MFRPFLPAAIILAGMIFALCCTSCTEPPTDENTADSQPTATDNGTSAAQLDDSATSSAVEELSGSLSIAGGTAHIPVMEEVQKVFAGLYPDLSISIAGGGSGVGIEQVGEGLVDIGNSGREAKPEEIEKYGLVPYRWAVDGVAVVVNPLNPLADLSKADLGRIFAGELTNWSELGGEDKGINVYTRDEESGTRSVFVGKALDDGPIVDTANVVVSNGAMKSTVSQDPYGIGYVSVGHIDETVKPVALDGVVPSTETVTSGEYPVARGLYSLTKGEATGAAKALLDFLYSEAGQLIIVDKGFIPVAR